MHKFLFAIEVAVAWNLQIFAETLTFLVLQDMTAEIAGTVYFSKTLFLSNFSKKCLCHKVQIP